jgi:hypothetical protein
MHQIYVPLLLIEQVHVDHCNLPLYDLRNEQDPRRVVQNLRSHSGQDHRIGREVAVVGGSKKGWSGGLVADVNEQQETMFIVFPNPAMGSHHISTRDLILRQVAFKQPSFVINYNKTI